MVDTNTAVRALEASHSNEGCNDENRKAIVETLARIGDKWTVMVVGALSKGPIRYNEIRRRVEGISQRMLTLTLKGLEQDGLATRTMYPTIPPRVDYRGAKRFCHSAEANVSLRSRRDRFRLRGLPQVVDSWSTST